MPVKTPLQWRLDGIVFRSLYKTRKGYKRARNFFRGVVRKYERQYAEA